MKKKYTILCLSVLILLFISCKKEPNEVGIGLQPENELLTASFFDTTTIVAYSTLHDDTIAVSGLSANVLGYVSDPVFGKVQAGVYTQFWLESYGANFGNNPQTDSLVLTIVYALSYGDTLNGFNVGVYELTEDIDKTKKYYSNSTLARKTENLATSTYFYPTPNIHPDSSYNNAVFRITLKPSFGDEKFLSKSNGVEFQSSAAFLNYFKGLFIVGENPQGDGSAVSIGLLNSRSQLTLYYHNDAGNYSYTFPINDSTARVGYFNHEHYNAACPDLKNQLSGDYSNSKEKLFLQSGFGVKTILNFPYIKQYFSEKKVTIHRAELVLSRYSDLDTTKYAYPSAISFNYFDTATSSYLSVADEILGSKYFGGTFNPNKDEYRIRLTKYIQYLIDGSGTEANLNLIPSIVGTRLSALSFYGTNPINDKNKRLRLEIYYSEIKD